MSETAAIIDSRPSVAGFAPGATGITAPSNPDRQGAFLTDIILELGFAHPESVKEAIDATRNSAKTPERHLLDTGAIDERQLSLALAERNGLDHVDLDQFEVDPEAAGLIGKPTAARYTALPIAFAADGALIVAIEDPFDLLGISDIEVMTRNEVRPVIATGTQIQGLIERLPERVPTPVIEQLESPAPTPEPPETPEPPGTPEPGPMTVSQPQPTPGPPPELAPEPLPDPVPEPAPPPGKPDPPVANGSEPSSTHDFEAELGELSATLTTLQDRMGHAGTLVEAVERRIGELHDVDARAQQAAIELANERAEFERERQRSVERELELEGELTAAREHITALEERLSKMTAAAELVNAASEKLVELHGVLKGDGPVTP